MNGAELSVTKSVLLVKLRLLDRWFDESINQLINQLTKQLFTQSKLSVSIRQSICQAPAVTPTGESRLQSSEWKMLIELDIRNILSS